MRLEATRPAQDAVPSWRSRPSSPISSSQKLAAEVIHSSVCCYICSFFQFYCLIETISGQFVSSDGAQPSSLVGVRGLGAQESREVTLQKGKRVIQEIASQLRINQHCMDTALNFFKMSVSRGLTRGRVRTHVV